MPEVYDCAANFGMAEAKHFGLALPIRGVVGDQQAALIGQACFRPGMVKSTYGTGCFILLKHQRKTLAPNNQLLTTIAYQWKGERTYAIEGSIFSAGATVQWLRDGLGVVAHAGETGDLAARADPDQRVYIVPAFTGMGAPYWDSEARAAIMGYARLDPQRNRPRGARIRGLPNARPRRCDALEQQSFRGRRPAVGDPRRRRDERQRLDHAIPFRHARCAGRPTGNRRDDGPRGGVSCRLAIRPISRPGGIRERLASAASVQSKDAECGTRIRVTADGAMR